MLLIMEMIFISYLINLLENLNLYLSDYIISEAEERNHQIKGRSRFWNKTIPYGARFVDLNSFKITKKINLRQKIGYIGRLNREKGILNFVKSIPIISYNNTQYNYLIGGGGELFQEIELEIIKMNQSIKIDLIGHINHNRMPLYLNELKLLVLPSDAEGLPTIILEAMACGTPVLATSVGAISEVIKNEINGFILQSKSPESIAKKVNEILNVSDLNKISKNARELVENKYSFEQGLKRYKKIIKEVMN